MTIQELLGSHELLALCNEVIPPCSDAAGAASSDVQKQLVLIFSKYRRDDLESLESLLAAAKSGGGKQHPYFPTFAETVTEAYWTSNIGLSLAGFTVAKAPD